MNQLSNTAPRISVLICTYNRAEYVKKTLESFCNQTIPLSHFEIIVIDDGSSDYTSKVIKSIEKQIHVRYFYQENAGLAAARNAALPKAHAPIVLFMDDDDVATPRLLEEHLYTHEHFPEEWFAVLGHTELAPEIASKPLMHFVTEVGYYLFSYPLIDKDRLDYTYFWGGRSSCKRSFLERHGTFNPIFRFGCEDIELGYRLSKHGLQVIYNPKARQIMIRNLAFDDFVQRLIRQGESQYVFSKIHADREIEQWTEVVGAETEWHALSELYENLVRSTRALDHIANKKMEYGFGLDKSTEKLLHKRYWDVFRASKLKGINKKMSEEKSTEYP